MSGFSNNILTGSLSILIFNSIFSIFLSSNLIKEENKFNNFWVKYNLILIPILFNKLYYCTLMHFCLKINKENKGYDLIPTSTLVSIYLFLWNLIYSFIKGIFDVNSNGLYFIQIIFSTIVCLPFFLIIIFFLIHSIILGYFCYLLFIFLSFFTCGSCCLSHLERIISSCKCRLCKKEKPFKCIYCSCKKLGSYFDSGNKCYLQCNFYGCYEINNCCDCSSFFCCKQ